MWPPVKYSFTHVLKRYHLSSVVKLLFRLTFALIRLEFRFLDLSNDFSYSANNFKTAVFLTLALIILEFWFLDTITSHMVQIILEVLLDRHC